VEAQHLHFIDTGYCLFFSVVALPFVSPFLLPNMAPPQTDTACHDCVKILQAAATLLSLKSKERPPMILFHNSYQMRLAANLSSSKCHMCTLLGESIPRLLEPPDPKELMGLAISKARHDPDAATVTLCGYESSVCNCPALPLPRPWQGRASISSRQGRVGQGSYILTVG
jgi:hypothetical protein